VCLAVCLFHVVTHLLLTFSLSAVAHRDGSVSLEPFPLLDTRTGSHFHAKCCHRPPPEEEASDSEEEREREKEREKEKEPEHADSDFVVFGSGIVCYCTLLRCLLSLALRTTVKFIKFLIVLFGILALLSTPAMVFYSMGSGDSAVSGIDVLGLTTIGNLGEGQPMCDSVRVGENMRLRCSPGVWGCKFMWV
jgi:hypothetical protein